MKALIISAIVLCSLDSFATTVGDDPSMAVSYCPSFWQRDLRLTQSQIIAINQIEVDFRQSVMDAYSARNEAPLNAGQINALVQRRSNKLWNVLTKRQQDKWQRIVSGYEKRGHYRNVSRKTSHKHIS